MSTLLFSVFIFSATVVAGSTYGLLLSVNAREIKQRLVLLQFIFSIVGAFILLISTITGKETIDSNLLIIYLVLQLTMFAFSVFGFFMLRSKSWSADEGVVKKLRYFGYILFTVSVVHWCLFVADTATLI